MKRDFDYTLKESVEMFQNDKDAISLFDVMDNMYHGVVALSADLQALPDLRLIKDSTPHDALHNASIALTNSKVKYSVQPVDPGSDEYKRANDLETVLDFNWRQSDRRPSGSTVLYNCFHSALRYDVVIVSVEDLYRWLPKDRSKWTKANKRAARLGRFPITNYHPSAVHFRTDPIGGLFKVFSARNMKLSEAMEYYEALAGEDEIGTQLKKTIDEIRNRFDANTYEKERVVLCDATDDDIRRIWLACVSNRTTVDEASIGKAEYKLIDADNEIPFLNWAIRGGASDMETQTAYKYHPMLASAHWFGTWENSILTRSLIISEAIRRVREIRGVYTGLGTDQVAPDDGTGGDKPLPPNVDFKRIPPSQMDPNANQVAHEIKQELGQTVGATILGNIGAFASSTTPFSTLNAVVQVEYSKMNPQIRLVKNLLADVGYIFCEWAKFNDKPLSAFLSEKSAKGERGQEIQSSANYDMDRLFIECSIEPERPTDESQRIQNERWLHELGKPARDSLEDLGVKDPDLAMKLRALEDLKQGLIAAQNAKIQQEAVTQVQMAAQQQLAQIQQMQAQMQQGAQGTPPPNQNEGLTTGQGSALAQEAPGAQGGNADQNQSPPGS